MLVYCPGLLGLLSTVHTVAFVIKENVEIIRNEMAYEGVSVIIARRACVRLSRDKKEEIKLKIAEISDSYC